MDPNLKKLNGLDQTFRLTTRYKKGRISGSTLLHCEQDPWRSDNCAELGVRLCSLDTAQESRRREYNINAANRVGSGVDTHRIWIRPYRKKPGPALSH